MQCFSHTACLQCLTCLPSQQVGHQTDCACAAVQGTLACKEVFRLSTRRRLRALRKLQKIWSAQPQLPYEGQAVAIVHFQLQHFALCTASGLSVPKACMM